MIVRLSTSLSSAPSPKSCRTAYVGDKGLPTILPKEVISASAEAPAGRRATEEEKDA